MRVWVHSFGVFLLVGGASVAAANALPSSGACTMMREGLPPDLAFSVSWMGEKAIINELGETTQGRVVGLRKHNDSFKLSILWEDPISGPSEIVIFETMQSFRMANVSYDYLPNGARVLGAIEGFSDADCTVVR